MALLTIQRNNFSGITSGTSPSSPQQVKKQQSSVLSARAAEVYQVRLQDAQGQNDLLLNTVSVDAPTNLTAGIPMGQGGQDIDGSMVRWFGHWMTIELSEDLVYLGCI